ncbi:MAG: phosphonate ABC transporter, permease protein PhnE, partial [Pseudomonadota bacterium]
MADISLGGAQRSVDSIQSSYMAQVQRRRLYGGLTLLIFVILMVSGFNVADARNAGGFWDGVHRIFDYPADVLSEAWEKRADLPGLIAKYFPALVETINIAAVSTLIGAIGGLFLSLLGTRGLAKWPRLIPLFRRISDIMRAVPEIVIALVLIFVLGGGPVP